MEPMTGILEHLKNLIDIDSPAGYTKNAAQYVMTALAGMGFTPTETNKGGVLCELGGAGDNGLMLCAHVDTLGAMVCEIRENGWLRLSPIGGIKGHNCEAENCSILTRSGQIFSGTLQLDSPSVHVNRDYSIQDRSFDTMEVVIDCPVFSKEDTEALGISVGDYVCFDPRLVVTDEGFIKSRFLDDKLCVAILLRYAQYLKDEAVSLPRKTYLHITAYEEVSHGASGSMPADVSELLALDMGCVGAPLQCTEFQVSICAKDAMGPSSYDMVSALIEKAKANALQYAVDVYPYYRSDADAALTAGQDVRHCLIGPGVYASHGYERAHLDGVRNTLALLKAYAG